MTHPIDRRFEFLAEIGEELDRAYARLGSEPWSSEEFAARLMALAHDVLISTCRMRPKQRREGIVRVAALCFRHVETGNRNRKDGQVG